MKNEDGQTVLTLEDDEKIVLDALVRFIRDGNVGVEAIYGWTTLEDDETEDAFYSLMNKL